jgi:hypothetical protein
MPGFCSLAEERGMHFTPSAAPYQMAESVLKWLAYKFLNCQTRIDIDQDLIDYALSLICPGQT